MKYCEVKCRDVMCSELKYENVAVAIQCMSLISVYTHSRISSAHIMMGGQRAYTAATVTLSTPNLLEIGSFAGPEIRCHTLLYFSLNSKS